MDLCQQSEVFAFALCRCVIAFLPRSMLLLISWLQSPSPSTVIPDAMILVFWMLSFKPAFSLFSFTLTKKLLSSSSLSDIRVVSYAYLTLLMFLLAILIPAYDSSSLAFRMMCSAYKLNKQGDNIQPGYTPFQFWTSQNYQFHVRF